MRPSRLTVSGTAADDDEGGGESCGDVGVGLCDCITLHISILFPFLVICSHHMTCSAQTICTATCTYSI